MELGRELDTVTTVGPTAIATSTPSHIDLLCDGLTSPNPGYGLPVVFDGTLFLPLPWVVKIGHHSTIYSAVDAALDHARKAGATHLTITLFSKLVWRQIVGRQGVDRLLGRRDAVVHAASRFAQVRWRLVAPPVSIGGRTIAVRGFRKAARVSSASAGVSPPPALVKVARPRKIPRPRPIVAPVNSTP